MTAKLQNPIRNSIRKWNYSVLFTEFPHNNDESSVNTEERTEEQNYHKNDEES